MTRRKGTIPTRSDAGVPRRAGLLSPRNIISVGLAAAIVALGLVLASVPRGGPASGGESEQVGGQPSYAQGNVKGATNASVSMVEFSDFQCPFCGRFAKETLGQIEQEYIKTGKVKLVFRHFPFLGQESVWAAEASECANEQGRFWDYHDELFSRQAGENRGAFSKAKLKRFAGEMGLDASAFAACLDSGRYTQKVRDDLAEGRRMGAKATPTFFINGNKVEGAQPFSVFQSLIEAERAK